MVKHTQTIRRLLSTNSVSVFDHVVGLALKGLIYLLSLPFFQSILLLLTLAKYPAQIFLKTHF